MIEIITVAYKDEVSLLYLQARSIKKFSKENTLYTIYWNSNYIDNDIIVTLNKELSCTNIYWRIILSSHVISEDILLKSLGRRTQQVLKLLASRNVTSDYYLILDAKNHFISHFSCDDLFLNGKPITHYQNYIGSGFAEFIDTSSNLLEVPNISLIRALPTTTPYLMITKDVIQMLDFLEKKYKNIFEVLFLNDDRFLHTSEFILYYAFIVKKYIDIKNAYEFKKPIYATFFRKAPDTTEKIENIMNKIENREVFVVGIHGKRIGNISPDIIRRFAIVWKDSGLIDSDVELLSFFPDAKI